MRRNAKLTLHEGEDLLVLLFGLALLHQVDLVLQDEDVLQLHDLYGCQVLGRLGLRARLVPRWREQNQKPTKVRNQLEQPPPIKPRFRLEIYR